MRTAVDVYSRVEVDEVLRELSDDELLDHLKERGHDLREQEKTIAGVLEDLDELLRSGQIGSARLLLQRWRFPKFKAVGDCVSAFVGRNRHTVSVRPS